MRAWYGRAFGPWVFVAALLLAPVAQADDNFGLYLQGDKQLVALPLAQTKVRGRLAGFVANVEVTQLFVNPFDATIEATYVFPLPEMAAVHEVVMRTGGHEIVAEIAPRQEAEKTYEDAVRAGKTASLLTQERPNVFTQKVGNIAPGDSVEVVLRYVEALPYEEGVSSFVFPTVVGPRYIPGESLDRQSLELNARADDTDQVPDASRITPPALAENEVSAHRIDLELRLEPGLPIANISSPSHRIEVDYESDRVAVVRLAKGDRLPNKDFILHTDLRGEKPDAAVITHRVSPKNGYLTLAIQPPARLAANVVTPKDLFFVVDNSGSMEGAPIEAAKSLVRQALGHMNPHDRFTIMRFSDAVSALSASPLANTPTNVALGLRFIDAMVGCGGTEMLSGIRRALEGSVEPGRVRIVFFLTDGYIGNDDEILEAVQHENHANARLFSLGVGSSVNRYLLANMARLGRGEMQVMRYDEDPEPFVARFYRKVKNPVLTDVRIDWGGLQIEQQIPAVIPDLFDGQPLLIHARYRTAGQATIALKGRMGGRSFQQDIDVSLPDEETRPEVASLWARAKIRALMDEEIASPGSREHEITELALQHSLLSKYTAFVAVDHERTTRRADEVLVPVAQRLPLPDGVTRSALGDLSRRFVPPGDPIIEIAAPEEVRSVTAYFPFGLVKTLQFDSIRQVWRGRFLVPAGIADGTYEITVVIEHADGHIETRREPYTLDSQAEDFVVERSDTALLPGELLSLLVDAVEPTKEVYVDAPSLGWERLPLTSFSESILWDGYLTIPRDASVGVHTVRVVVRDVAGNRLEQTFELTILGAR